MGYKNKNKIQKKNKKISFKQKMINKYKETNKKSIMVYLVLRVLVIICIVFEVLRGNIENVLLAGSALFLFTIPTMISEKFNIGIPSVLEAIIYLFIYSATILGEINNFYGIIPFWDTLLHTLNGFLCAGIGFSLVDILNTNSDKFNLSPIYLILVAFCFSMTIGILWEFIEFSADSYLKKDMQKDRIVQTISSVELNENKENVPVIVDNITKTEVYKSNGEVITINNGYLDIGLIDTMKDLFVNFLGAIVFSFLAYLYVKNRDKYKFAGEFIPHKN